MRGDIKAVQPGRLSLNQSPPAVRPSSRRKAPRTVNLIAWLHLSGTERVNESNWSSRAGRRLQLARRWTALQKVANARGNSSAIRRGEVTRRRQVDIPCSQFASINSIVGYAIRSLNRCQAALLQDSSSKWQRDRDRYWRRGRVMLC